MVEVTTETSAQTTKRMNSSHFSLNSLTPPANIFQELQVERYRLNYLLNCRYCKRPPQSLRFSGGHTLGTKQRLSLISEFETKALLIAIQNKKNDIYKLERQIQDVEVGLDPLSKKLKKKHYHHYQSKIQFYNQQEHLKWKEWPSKGKHKQDKTATYRCNKIKRRKAKQVKEIADKLLNEGDVRNLTQIDIPPEAVVVLGKGLGFIPTPPSNNEELRLDARLVTNKIIYNGVNKEKQNDNSNTPKKIPTKLYVPNYQQAPLPNDRSIKQTVEHINTKTNALENKHSKSHPKNLSYAELQGLKWLQQKTNKGEITITKADKGGSILIVPPEMMEKKVAEKVLNANLYEKLTNDPRTKVHNTLYQHWMAGKVSKFVSTYEAKEVMGITENNTKSTSSKYKSGISYFNPSLKIHKLEPEEIKPGCNIPARLITAAQDGVTKRSDIFIQQKWLNDLQTDFCKDLVSDTNETLMWLEDQNSQLSQNTKTNLLPFTFDFESLYDSISPTLVHEALSVAIAECRPQWTSKFRDWIVELCNISMRSSFAIYKETWYKQIDGIPTGGTLSVQLANITVYYVLRNCLYSNEELMSMVINNGIKRFIDDGVGLYSGTVEEFQSFSEKVGEAVNRYGLSIKKEDWKVSKGVNDPIHFLDIMFWFDDFGQLQTDLYMKPTDSRSYLNFNSCHPKHIFPGIIYTQALRLRRIINSDDRLSSRLDKLKEDFLRAKYPMKMINNIVEKVKTLPRILGKKEKELSNVRNNNKINIRVVSTYGRDQPLTNILETIPHKELFQFNYVKRTAPSLQDTLCNTKFPSMGPKLGCSGKCSRCRCKCCQMMSNKTSFETQLDGKNKTFFTSKGNCTTQNVVYLAACKSCRKHYVGRTTQPLSERVNCHRASFVRYVKTNGKLNVPTKILDNFALGIHLFNDHNLKTNEEFDKAYELYILEVCSPRIIDVKEHTWIHKLKALYPKGLNLTNTFGLPLLS